VDFFLLHIQNGNILFLDYRFLTAASPFTLDLLPRQ